MNDVAQRRRNAERVREYRYDRGEYRPEIRECRACLQPFLAPRRKSVTCSAECWRFYTTHMDPRPYRKPKGRGPQRRRLLPLPCTMCGTPTLTTGRRVTCSPCRKARRQTTDRRRNAARRNIRLVGDTYSIEDLGKRDGWRCHICHRRVKPDTSRMSPMGATVDHLIPVSEGGQDTLVNVALAHRACNTKRQTGEAQLRLIA